MSLLLLALTLAGCDAKTSAPVAAAAKPHSVTLTWNASSSKVSGYRIYRTTDPPVRPTDPPVPPPVAATLPDVTRWEDTAVEPGATYYYSVTSRGLNLIESAPARVTVTVPTN
jgi:hypothetical protein